MKNIFLKIIMLIIVTAFLTFIIAPERLLIPVIAIIAAYVIMFASKNKIIKSAVFILCVAGSCFYPELIFYLPLLFDAFLFTKIQIIILLCVAPLVANYDFFDKTEYIYLAFIVLSEFQLKGWQYNLSNMKKDYTAKYKDIDSQKEKMKQQIKELTEKQDTECQIATLNERNRIAREIHDSVGHLLSSSILQIAAIMSVTKDENEKEMLKNVKETLTEGMNSVRKSVHDLNNESMNLKLRLISITEAFNFCKIQFNYNFTTDPELRVKYDIIAVVKEALVNVIKHSNATSVKIQLDESLNDYILSIKDNGNKFVTKESGIGLQNMRERAEGLNGKFLIETDGGFGIIFKIPINSTEEKI